MGHAIATAEEPCHIFRLPEGYTEPRAHNQIRYLSENKGILSPVGMRGLLCSMLKRQNSYEFIHNLKNSNNIQKFTGVYWLRWRHCLLECLLVKKLHLLVTTKVQVGRKEIYNITVKKTVLASASKDKEICDRVTKNKSINVN